MVRVHCGIRITSPALLLDIAADSHSPREGKVETSAVVEVIMVEVRSRRIIAAIEVIVESSVHIGFHLPSTFPVLSESEAYSLTEVATSSHVLYRHLVFASIQITDVFRSAEGRIHVESPMLFAVQSGIEVVVRPRIPIAVHVDGHRYATTRNLIIFRSIRGAIPRCMELKSNRICALVVDNRSSILELDILSEARL